MALNQDIRFAYLLGRAAVRAGVKQAAAEEFIERASKILGPDGVGNQSLVDGALAHLCLEAPNLFGQDEELAAAGQGGGKTIAAGDPVAFGQNLEKIAKGEVRIERSR